MGNRELKEFYDNVYKRGEKKHYTPLLFSGDKIPPARIEVLKELSWKGKRVLDAGCGTGELAYEIAKRGAIEVIGVDYSREAIDIAKKKYRSVKLSYQCKSIHDIVGRFDAVVSLGTLEHMDKPEEALLFLKSLLRPKGHLIVTVPNWLNPRGFILMSLRYCYGAKITLADFNYFTPRDFEYFSRRLKMKLRWRTVDHEWAQGKKMIADLARRLPRVIEGGTTMQVQKRIDMFLEWLQAHVIGVVPETRVSGAVALYHFKK